MSRTDAENALERLAWTLNFHRGETISVNQLANEADISWATAQKYSSFMEVLERIAPSISATEDGITVKAVGKNLKDLQNQKDIQLLIYLLVQAEIEGGPLEPIRISDRLGVFHKYADTIEELDELGWLETSEESIKLTPEGVSIAAPARSRIRDRDLAISDNVKELTPEELSLYEDYTRKIPWDGRKSASRGISTGGKGDYHAPKERYPVIQP